MKIRSDSNSRRCCAVYFLPAITVLLCCFADGLYAQEASGPESVTAKTPVGVLHLTADKMRWLNRRDPDEVRLWEGNVQFEIPYEGAIVTFRADKVAFEVAKEIITATGNVVIEDGTSTIRSHLMVYEAALRKAHFQGKPDESMGVALSQKLESGEANSYETDWLVATFGTDGLDEIETGRGQGRFILTGEEPLPFAPVSPVEPFEAQKASPLPRKISPPSPDE